MSPNQPFPENKGSGPQVPASWGSQINRAFLFSSYGSLTTPQASFSVSTISAVGASAHNLLHCPLSELIKEPKALGNFVAEHAYAIEATIVNFASRGEIKKLIADSLIATQKQLGQIGELSGSEVSKATVLPPGFDLSSILGDVPGVIATLSTADASAALAAQRAGLVPEIGRGLLAIRLVIKLQEFLHGEVAK